MGGGGGGWGGGGGNDGFGDFFFFFLCVYLSDTKKERRRKKKKKRHGLLKHISTVSLFFYVPAPYEKEGAGDRRFYSLFLCVYMCVIHF